MQRGFLPIKIPQKNIFAVMRKIARQIDGERGFTRATFGICDKNSFHGGPRLVGKCDRQRKRSIRCPIRYQIRRVLVNTLEYPPDLGIFKYRTWSGFQAQNAPQATPILVFIN